MSKNQKGSVRAARERLAQLRNSGLRSPTSIYSSNKIVEGEQSPQWPLPKTPNGNDSRKSSADLSLSSFSDFPTPIGASKTPTQPSHPSRRALSSYYSQFTNVSPIIEESEGRNSIRSYATSNIIPSSTADNFFYEDGDGPSDDENVGDTREEHDFEKSPVSSTQEVLVKRGLSAPIAKLASSSQIELEKYLGELERDHAKASEVTTLKQVKQGTLADRVGSKVPAKLQVPKEEVNRASTTSLPDLIRRATKLAANLDRGKTASRLGTEWFTIGNGSFAHTDLEKSALGSRRNLDSTLPNTSSRSVDRSDGPLFTSRGHNSRYPTSYNGRHYCGMTRKTFYGLLILALLLIFAAVMIPVALLVLPRLKMSINEPQAKTECSKQLICQNGGFSTAIGGTCACVCAKEFNGYKCQNPSEGSCATVDVPLLNNFQATVGNQVRPLLATNYSIPLDKRLVVLQFAKFNMSCASENALVTIPTVQTLKSRALTFAETGTGSKQENSTTPTGAAAGGQSTASVNMAANGSAISLAKVAILFVLQDSQAIVTASEAQSNLATFFGTLAKNNSYDGSQNIVLGSGYEMNLWDGTIIKDGTIYGRNVTGSS